MSRRILAVAAHPDDAEIGCSGTLLLAKAAGWTVGVVDLTRGEAGTRGTAEDRAREWEAASRVLGLDFRKNLALPDSRLQANLEATDLLARVYREFRPDVVLAPPWKDRHPDHATAGDLAWRASWNAGLRSLDLGIEPFRPRAILRYAMSWIFEPQVIVDITPHWEGKAEAIRCYSSQLHRDGSDEPETRIAHPDFLKRIETRARFFGDRIGVDYAEAFAHDGPIPIRDADALAGLARPGVA